MRVLVVQSLAASRVEQQRLVDHAAHELGTPLTSPRTNVELLQRLMQWTIPAAAQTQEALAGIEEEVEDLTALVQELIALAAGSSPELRRPPPSGWTRPSRASSTARGRSGRTVEMAPSRSCWTGPAASWGAPSATSWATP